MKGEEAKAHCFRVAEHLLKPLERLAVAAAGRDPAAGTDELRGDIRSVDAADHAAKRHRLGAQSDNDVGPKTTEPAGQHRNDDDGCHRSGTDQNFQRCRQDLTEWLRRARESREGN